MSAPSKPWEQDRMTQGRTLQSSAPMLQSMPGHSGSRGRTGPPNLPPRPSVMSSLPSNYLNGSSSYGAYSSPYSRTMGMGYSPYSNYSSYGGGYGGYGSFGGYGGGMYGGMGGGMYGNNSYGFGPESRFIQLAEESTRPAFQGIESLVRAFGSIAMMFDSTFFAVQSSFRAVLGVAENFGRIRTMFGQLWSSFALLRFLNWCYRKLLSMFGFKVTQDLGKAAWNEALNEATGDGIQLQNTSSWPIFMFLGMIVSAPYLISKLLPPLVDKRDPKNWNSPGKPVRAIHAFQANNEQELTIIPGDTIQLAPLSIQQEMELTNTGWVYASSERGTGIIPVNYVQPVSVRRVEPYNPNSAPISASAPLVEERRVFNEEEYKKLAEELGKPGESSQNED